MSEIIVRGFQSGEMKFEDRVDSDGADIRQLGEKHVRQLLGDDPDNAEPYTIEIEFLEETDPLQRFFRFGTDKHGMVLPLEIDLGHTENRLEEVRKRLADAAVRAEALHFFERRVIQTAPIDENWTEVKLDCGHTTEIVCYTPVSVMPCAQCVNEAVKTGRLPR